tara:strand:- start:128 stop:421 length:294 start_codon:yes stop_codon:yes gene_type:complete
MAIIKYTLVNGQTPSGLSSRGDWHSPVEETYIGVGSGLGTELSIAELKTYVKGLKSITNMLYMEYDGDTPVVTVNRQYTDAEIESAVDAWCTAKGIS